MTDSEKLDKLMTWVKLLVDEVRKLKEAQSGGNGK